MFCQALEDTVLGIEKPLVILSGEYLVGTHYTAALNNGSELFEWSMNNDEYTACFSTEPAFPKPFPSTPKHLHCCSTPVFRRSIILGVLVFVLCAIEWAHRNHIFRCGV